MTTAIKDGPRSASSTSSPPSAPDELDVFIGFCEGVLTVESGAALEIEGFQRTMLETYFGGVRETLILIPKKNGKTTMLAALGIFHLLTTPDADCVIAAASREQADVMLRQARGFIRRSEELSARLGVNKREITYSRLGGRLKIVASDVDTVQGWIGTLALIDEVGHHKDENLYAVFRDGLGPRNGQIVAISTAGDDEMSALGLFRSRLYELPGFRRDGAYRHVETEDYALHEWALDPDQDLDDLELVKTANPASWQTIKELRKRHESFSMRPWQWARFACGAWVTGEDAAISEKEWAACADPGVEIPPGTTGVFVGVDLATKWDTTAFVPIAKLQDKVVVGRPTILVPPQDGTSLDYHEITEAAKEIADRFPEATFIFDPTRGGEQFAQFIEGELENAGVVIHSQDPRPMALAAERLSGAIAGHELTHPADPQLTRHVLAAAAYWVGERWKFVKQKRKKLPIDGVVALAMAYSTLVGEGAKSREVLMI